MITVNAKGHEFPEPTEGMTVSELVPKELKGKVIAGKINGELVDLDRPVPANCEVDFITIDDPEGLEIIRHSTSHIMAEAVRELFPGVKVTIGPAIKDGFYYDFDTEKPFTPEDLVAIEKKMKEIIKKELPFTREIMPVGDAIKLFKGMGENYKVELLEDIESKEVSLYTQGNFTDLCRGPHIPSTRFVKAFSLTSVAGAYWRGDENKKMLQRIYGTAFPDKDSLKNYLNMIEEAKKRDHRKIGRDLDLFQFNDEAGAGLAIYHPKGTVMRIIIEDFLRKEHLKRGYDIVMGPMILKQELWEKSGHYDNYRENMYFTEVEGQKYGIKPMNCLAHMLIYKSRLRSYRDLPIRYFELGTVHRHEKSGVLHGLLRVRAFTQDDAHLICTPDQLIDEIVGVMDFVMYVMDIFGFPYKMEISTRPEKSIGSDEDWELATRALENALKGQGKEYEINEGDGAFYGPKIDFILKDAIGREWQCATIQCDFTLPERFDLTYIDSNGEKKRPVMLHRVILGSVDRFLGILIEHYAGAFPVGLAPVQAVVMNITDDHLDYSKKVVEKLKGAGIRVESDFRNEKLGLKIREAELKKIPYTLIIGDREKEEEKVTPRKLGGKNLDAMNTEDFINLIRSENSAFWRD
ncbi:MAG: threonine--tRNA ligase [Deltaproteobacteria bacterium]|uniref:Threonine--tRNA ligase n=1 Tax=Candidatus Zymogenus saltonus TaxID=2844893 RepID=A0A9D8KI50_9DELT|nr:threonine--tRNA ligase [Candidatus Zymogenus saltonus]